MLGITHSVDRLGFIPFFLERWQGWFREERMSRRSICITLHVKKNDVPDAVRTIHRFQLPDRVRIVLYIPLASRDIPGVYPVNKLRNIAIVNVVTTHFLVLDMDMWPSRTCLLRK